MCRLVLGSTSYRFDTRVVVYWKLGPTSTGRKGVVGRGVRVSTVTVRVQVLSVTDPDLVSQDKGRDEVDVVLTGFKSEGSSVKEILSLCLHENSLYVVRTIRAHDIYTLNTPFTLETQYRLNSP